MNAFFAVLQFVLCFPKEINGFRTFIPSLERHWLTKIYLTSEWRPKITFSKKNRLNSCKDTMENLLDQLNVR